MATTCREVRYAMTIAAALVLLAACGASFEAARTLERGEYQKAADMYRGLLSEGDGGWLDRMNYGRALLGAGESEAARVELSRAAEESSGRWEPEYWLGASHLLEGQVTEGLRIMDERMIADSIFMKRDLIRGALSAVEKGGDRGEKMQRLRAAVLDAENRETRRRNAQSRD